MARDYYKTTCGAITPAKKVCGAEVRIEAEDLPELIKTHAQILCPLGHGIAFSDANDSAHAALKWLTDKYPELLWPKEEKKRKRPNCNPDPPPKEPTEEEKVKALEACIADIDDYLARRGKYEPHNGSKESHEP